VLQVQIRRALPGEAANLSALALRSKALWGYDAAFMEACRAPLTVDPEAIAKYPFYVLDEGGTITGFYGLSGQPPRGEIEFLFVEPESVRRGRGQRLARHFLALARSLGFEEMDVSADPFAENFYVAMGAVRIAEVPSDAIPNRLIPRLRFSLLADRVTAHHLSDLHIAHPGGEKGPPDDLGTKSVGDRSAWPLCR
jgi:N-acetylglutamate synthase-like GNAT family acetyltransferase